MTKELIKITNYQQPLRRFLLSPKRVIFILIAAFIFTILAFENLNTKAYAATGINRTINFQGKVVNKDGTNVADGLYTFVFKLYDAASSGANPWTETQNNVQVTAGIFRVSLGSTTTFASAGVDFNTDNLYLGINFNSDGEMTPRVRFAAVPYAINAETVGGLTVTNTTGTLTIPNSKTVQFGGAFTTSAQDLTLTLSGATTVTLPTTGTLATLAGTENLSNKSFTSTVTFSGISTDIATGSNETLTIAPNGTGNVLVQSQSGGQAALIVDKTGLGDIFAASSSGTTRFVIKTDGTASSSAGFTLDGIGNIQSTRNQTLTLGGGSTGTLVVGRTGQVVTLPGFDCSGQSNGGKLTTTSGGVLACSADTSGAGGGENYWQYDSTTGIIATGNLTAATLFGGTASNSALLRIAGTANSGTVPVASISAKTSYASLVIDQSGVGDIFTASASGQKRFTIANSGNVLIGTGSATERLVLAGGNFLQTALGNPTQKGIYDTPGSAQGIYVSGKYAYIADHSNGLLILDVSNPASPTQIGRVATVNNAWGVYVSGKYAYVADDTSGLLIIDISNPLAPQQIGVYDTTGTAKGVFVSGKYAYVGDGSSGLEIIDISNPATPTLVGNYNTPGTATSVFVLGKYAYIADDTSGVPIIDISDPSTPKLIGTATSSLAQDVTVVGRYLYIADFTAGLRIMDIINPAAPTLAGVYDTPGLASGIQVAGRYGYLADGSTGGFAVIDIANPTAMSYIGNVSPAGGSANKVFVSGKYAYIADNNSGVQVIDINGTEVPTLNAGNIATNDINIFNNANISNNLSIGNALNIGSGGILSSGTITVITASGAANLIQGAPTGLALLILNQTGNQDIFSASASGISKFVIKNDGTASSSAGFTIDGVGSVQSTKNQTLTLGGGSTGALVFGRTSQVITLPGFDCSASGNGGKLTTTSGGVLTCSADTSAAGSSTPFEANNGVITQLITTQDLLIGGTSTVSAKFAILGVNNARGSQTASLSGSLVLDAAGSLQTTLNQTLTIGGDTTGNINFKPGNSASSLFLGSNGNVGIGTSAPGSALDVVGSLLLGANSTIDTRASGTLSIGTAATTTGLTLGRSGNTTTFNSTSWTATPTISGLITATSGVSIANGQSYTGAGTVTVSSASNNNLTISALGSGTTIITSDEDTGLKIGTSSNTIAPLSVSGGIGSNALAIFNQINGTDILAASAAGVTKFVVKNDGTASSSAGFSVDGVGNIQSTKFQTLTVGGGSTGNLVIGRTSQTVTLPGFTTNGGIIYTTNTGVLAQTGAGTATQCLLGGAGTPTFGSCATGVNSSPFYEITTQGIIVEGNTTEDFLLGGVGSTSAKFAILGIAGSLTPTASISAQNAGGQALVLGGDGSIQSVRNNTLTLGGNTTGDISFKPGNVSTPALYLGSNGNVGIGTTTPGSALDVVGSLLLGANSTIDTRASGTLSIGTASNTSGLTLGRSGNTTTFNSTSWTATPTISGLITATSGVSIANGQSYTGAGTVTVSSASGNDLTISALGSGNTIITSDYDTGLRIGTSANTPAIVSITGGIGSNAGLIVNRDGTVDDIFAASSSGTTKFRITNNGTASSSAGFTIDGVGNIQSTKNQTLTLGGNSTGDLVLSGRNGNNNGIIFSGYSTGIIHADSSGRLTSSAINLASSDVTGILPIANGGSPWNQNSSLGTVFEGNTTLDLLIGGTASTSSKFAFLNVAGGTPTLKIFSSDSSQSMSLYHDGTNGYITSTTGTINIGNGAGTVYLDAALVNDTANYNGAVKVADKFFVQSSETTGNALVVFDNTGLGDILAASASGVSKFVIKNDGTASTSAGLTINGTGRLQETKNQTLYIGGDTTGEVHIEDSLFLGVNEVTNGGLTFYSSGVGITDPTITTDASGNLILSAPSGTVQVGSGTGNITLSLTVAADVFIADKTVTLSSAYTGDDYTFKRVLTGGANNQGGTVVNITDVSGGSGTINDTLLKVNSALTSGNFTGYLGLFQQNGVDKFRIQGSGTTPVASVAAATSYAGLVVDNSGTGDLIAASSSGATRFVVTQSGNVGINTSIPTEKLEVGGNIKIGAQTNSSLATQQTFTKISNTTAGTIKTGDTTGIASISAMSVFEGSLYVGTHKSIGGAEIYRYDGTGTNWTKVSQVTAGTIAASGTSGIASVSAMTVWNGNLYVGTSSMNAAEIYRYDGGTNWTKVSGAAGTIQTTASIDGVFSLTVFGGNLYAGTKEPGKAELYRYNGGTSWSAVNTTAGTFIATDAVAIDAITTMVVKNGLLYMGTQKGAVASTIRYNGGVGSTNVFFGNVNATGGTGSYLVNGSAVTGYNEVTAMTVYNGSVVVAFRKGGGLADILMLSDGNSTAITSTPDNWVRLNSAAGTITTGGTASIDQVDSLTVYNGRLYAGTKKGAATAEIYRYETIGTWTKLFVTGTLTSGGTGIDSISKLIQYNGDLILGTYKQSGGAEVYKYTSVLDQSFALKFNASSTLGGGTQNGLNNEGSIYFVATASANLNSTSANTGSFIFSHGLITSTGAYDVAEDYPTRDTEIQPGDIVEIEPGEKGFVRKSSSAYSKGLIGVYSEKPGFRLSQVDNSIDGSPVIPVALAGRVPVRVSIENGPIAAGDYLTSSSIAGVAMKATKAGYVIGKAMESYSGEGIGKVLMYVNASQYLGSEFDALGGLSADGERPSNPAKTFLALSAINSRTVEDRALSSIVTDRILAGVEVVSPKITTNSLIVDTIQGLSGDDITVVLGEKGKFTFGNSTNSAGITFDSQGNAHFAGTITVDKIIANQIGGLEIITNSISSITKKIDNSGSEYANKLIILEQSQTSLITQMASISARLEKMDNLNLLTMVDVASGEGSITTLANLAVFNTATFAQATVLDNLQVGNNMTFSAASINTIGTDLEIQSLRQGAVSFLGGLIKFDTDGKVTFAEDVAFQKNVTVTGVLSAHTVAGTELQLAQGTTTVLSDTEVDATAAAGLVTLKHGTDHIKINNPLVKDTSFIFITPKTKTSHNLFLFEQKEAKDDEKGSFTVGVDGKSNEDIKFNYLIVN